MKELRREQRTNGGYVWIEDGIGDYMVALGPRGGALWCMCRRSKCRHISFVRKLRRRKKR